MEQGVTLLLGGWIPIHPLNVEHLVNCWRMWLRPETGERAFCVPKDLHTLCGSKESKVCGAETRSVLSASSEVHRPASRTQPRQAGDGEPFGPHPESLGSGGQVVRRWEAERLLAQKTHYTSTKGSL